MRLALLLSYLAILSVANNTTAAEKLPAAVDHLRCEYRENPLGIDVLQPRLCWRMKDSRRGAAQTAYQILAADSPEKLAAGDGNFWDSGRVESDRSIQIVYKGKPLASRMSCHWKVRIWDADGKPTEYSRPALWTMGLLKPEDVKAQWIGTGEPLEHPLTKAESKEAAVDFEGCNWVWHPVPGADPRKAVKPGEWFFRKDITLPRGRQLASARFLMAADNSANMFVNGKRVVVVGGFGFSVGQVADITALLKPGNNQLAVSAINVGDNANPAGLIGKLIIRFNQGDPLVLKIDETWKSTPDALTDWKTCKLDTGKWKAAAVIGKHGDPPWNKLGRAMALIRGCPQIRKQFDVSGPIRRATVYASALGLYKLHINGRKVCDDYFTPGWTDYNKRVYYNTYDVTELVKAGGENAVAAELAAGWYSGAIGWQKQGDIYGKHCNLFVQLEIEMADGAVKTICTDPSWKYAYGPLVEGEFLPGETYDARLETPGWDKAGFDDSAWKPVVVSKRIDAKFEGYMSQPVRATGTLKTQKVTQPVPGKFIFDLGQNFAGFARLKVKGPAGTRVQMRFAEILNPDGTLYTTNLRGARCIDSYVLRGGDSEEIWQPQFTFHGFRYVEISGYPGTPTADAVTGVALNSDTPLAGSFACSSPMVNRLYGNIVWTQRANFIDIPTDCPQRDERLGWTGDAQVFIRAAAYNADVAAFFTKWLIDLEDAQRPDGAFTDIAPFIGCGSGTAGWADAGTICPWVVHTFYDDTRVLEKHYPSMVRFVDYCKKHSNNLIRPAAGYGDWLSIKADTPKDVMATAYFARSVKLTADAARVLGKSEDAQKFDALYDEIKAAFNKAFVGPDGRIKGNTQTVYVLAIWFGLLSEENEKTAARYLVEDIQSRDNHLSTGFNGTAYLMPTLAKTGNNATAYKLLLNDTFPSWGYSIKHGATSIWERWDGWTADNGFQDPGMNSFAHYSFGAVARWMFQSVAGIGTDGPGFKRLRITPCPGQGLTWVKAGYGSIHGPIQSDWRTENGRLAMDVTIPANTSATIVVPCGDPQKISEGGRPLADAPGITLVSASDGEVVLKAAAGKYSFAAPWKE